MRAKFIYEYLELPGKSNEDIISDLSKLSKKELNKLLIDAADDGLIYKVKLLINAGADINAKDINNISVLQTAALYGFIDIVQELLNHGVDVNQTNSKKSSPLALAIWKGYKDIEKLLKKHGAKQ